MQATLKEIWQRLAAIKEAQGLNSPAFKAAFEDLVAQAQSSRTNPEVQQAVLELDRIRQEQGLVSSAFLRKFNELDPIVRSGDGPVNGPVDAPPIVNPVNKSPSTHPPASEKGNKKGKKS
ncbi:MAG: hypothetical protein JW934_15620 [Anaerolineae bacterium]|nr:hypothetical protein [Anaerolineae bacterium]